MQLTLARPAAHHWYGLSSIVVLTAVKNFIEVSHRT